jgi:preprotein translocase subunit SecD
MASKAADPISTVLTNITQKLRSGRRQCDIGKEVLRAALAKARVSEKEVQGLRNAIERLTAEKQQLLAAVSLSTAKQRPSNTTTTTTMSKEAREESKLKDQIVQGCQVFTRQKKT